MDVRHPLKELDQQIVKWAVHCQLPLHVLLTKSDKLSYGSATMALRQVEQKLHTYSEEIGVQLFSSLDKIGLEQLWITLDEWLN